MRVLLVYLCNFKDRKDYYLSLLPYGLPSMAAFLESQGIEVSLANFSSMGHVKAATRVRDIAPDVLGISIFSFNRSESLKLAERVSRECPGIVIVAGGPFASHFSSLPADRFPGIDHIVRGEGEEALLRLVSDLGKGRKPDRIIGGTPVQDLDSLPFASSFGGPSIGVDRLQQNSFIVTSRGCPGTCTYCCSPSFWGNAVRFRSAVGIVDEIEHLYLRNGIIYFSIRDDNFTLRKNRVIEFCEELERRGIYILWNCQARMDTIDQEILAAMKRAGLEHIQYGVESGSPRILAAMNKRLNPELMARTADDTRKAGVILSVYLMAGMPGETEEDIDRTAELVKRMRPHDGIVSPVAYYPGTGLYDELKAGGLVDDEIWFTREESGFYARTDRNAVRWVRRLAGLLADGAEKNRYRHGDFSLHRTVAGGDCWVTDLMEGDLFADEGKFPRAEKLYRRVIAGRPGNIWGYLRLGAMGESMDDIDFSINAYEAAADTLPSYYGSWSELARLHRMRGDSSLARRYATMALERNPHDHDSAAIVKKPGKV